MPATFHAHAPAIHCDGCANSIRRLLGKLPGVQNVQVDIEQQNVVVDYEPTQVNESQLRERLTQAGFPVA